MANLNGRPHGCRDKVLVELEEALERAKGATLEQRLIAVVADNTQPTRLRLVALNSEHNLLALRIRAGADG